MSSSCNHEQDDDGRVVAIIAAVDRLRTSLTHSSLAVALQGAEVRQVRTGTNDSLVSAAAGRLMGWSLRETTGTDSALLYIRDGVDTEGAIIAPIALAPGESTRDSWFPGGLSFVYGVYVDVISGAVEGAVFLGGVV